MALFAEAFDELWDAQTEALGIEIRATIAPYTTDAKAILGEVDADMQIISGGIADAGGYEVQIKASDFTGEPPKGTPATCNGEAAGLALETGKVSKKGAVWVIPLFDYSAKD